MKKRLLKYYRRKHTARHQTCTACGCTLSAFAFVKCLWNDSGLSSRCKTCDNLRHVLKTRKRNELGAFKRGELSFARKVHLFHARPRQQDTHAAQERLRWRWGGDPDLHPSLKVCTNCGRTLHRQHFAKRGKGSADGLSSWCALCSRVARNGRRVPKIRPRIRYTPTINSLLPVRQPVEGVLPAFKPLPLNYLGQQEK
jgi:hypothetical protein